MQKKYIIHILGIYLLLMIIIPKDFNNIAGIIPIRLVLSGLFTLLFIIYKIKNKDYKLEGKKYLVLGIVFLLSCLVSLINTSSLVVSIYSIIKFGVAFLVFFSMYNMNIDKDDLKILFRYLGVGLLTVIIYGLIQYIFKVNLFTIGSYNYPGSRGRISATFFNTIYFSIFLNMIIVLLTYLSYKLKDVKLKSLSIVFLILSYVCMLLTFTRSAILIFVGCLVVSAIFNHKIIFNKIIIITYILMIGLSFLIPGVPSLYKRTFGDINTLAATNETEDPSLEHRMKFSEIGIVIGKDYFPTGIGLGSFEKYINSKDYETHYPEYIEYKTHPHSSLILLFAEASIWPIITLFVILFFMAFDLIKIWFTNRKKEASYLAVLAATILGGYFVVNVIAENAIYDSQIFPIFLIIYGGILSYIRKVKLCQK